MPIADSAIQDLEKAFAEGGTAAVLDELVGQLRDQRRHHELFEALKLRVRHRLGLPLQTSASDLELADELRDQLEDGLIEACREVGTMLLDAGQIREGWMFLRPVGDKAAVAAALADIEVDEDNVEELVEVSLHEGVDPPRGFALVLEHFGTCNAITTFESAMPQHSRRDQQQAARLLLESVHRDLLQSVRDDVTRQAGEAVAADSLRELVEGREWLFGEYAYHIDTTHLASTVRFARLLDDPASLRIALDLTEYGRRLNAQFQYEGEEPFTDFYPSHALFFQAMLGEHTAEALQFFADKAESVDARQHGTAAIEVYIHLLAHCRQYETAIEATCRLITPELQRYLSGYAPSLLELSQAAGQYAQALDLARQRDDLYGYAVTLLNARSGAGQE